MGSLGWLAISDLHVGSMLSPTLWSQGEDELFRDLERVHKSAGPFDVVLCLGDLVQTGARDEHMLVRRRLDTIFSHLAQLGSKPGLLVVPGNHDLIRADERNAAVRPLLHWGYDPDLRSTLFWHETTGKPYRDVVKTAFAEHTRFMAEFYEAHPLPDTWTFSDAGLLPGDMVATVRAGGISLGVVGLCSAFLQVTPHVQRGGVAIHPHQLLTLVGDPRLWATEHDICFLLTHHPPEWLTSDALPLYQGAIFRPELFGAHFCGHLHEPQLTAVQPGASPSKLFQIPSLLGLERWIDTHEEGVLRAHGYAAGRLLMEDDHQHVSLRIWPRTVQANKGRLRFVPNYADFELDEDNALTVDLGMRPSLQPVRSLRTLRASWPRLPTEPKLAEPASKPKRPIQASTTTEVGTKEAVKTSVPIHAPSPPPAPSPSSPAFLAQDEDIEPEPPGLGYHPRWYVENEAKEQLILGTLRHPGAPVVVTAPPFSGKTTVLQRIVARLRGEHREGRERCLVILLDLGSLSDTTLANPAEFFAEIANMLVDGYERAMRESGDLAPDDTESWVERAWKRPGSPEARLTNLFERRVLAPDRNRTVLALDRADRFVGKPCGDPMARMLRQWVRAGALGDELWVQFRLALAASGSALYFYTPDAVSELFASATHIRIESFGLTDIRSLAQCYGGHWTDDELRHIIDLVGGQPYLCRMILFLERTGVLKSELLDVDRLKIEHCATVLRQVWLRVAEQPDLRKPLCLLLRDPGTKLTTDEYHRLYQAGLVRREEGAYVLPNKLIASYFQEQC